MKKLFTIIIILFLLLFGIYAVKLSWPTEKLNTKDYVYHSQMIEKGDTLWSYAEENVLPNDNIRSYIDEVKRINNMTSDFIVEGQYIIIMVPAKGV